MTPRLYGFAIVGQVAHDLTPSGKAKCGMRVDYTRKRDKPLCRWCRRGVVYGQAQALKAVSA